MDVPESNESFYTRKVWLWNDDAGRVEWGHSSRQILKTLYLKCLLSEANSDNILGLLQGLSTMFCAINSLGFLCEVAKGVNIQALGLDYS